MLSSIYMYGKWVLASLAIIIMQRQESLRMRLPVYRFPKVIITAAVQCTYIVVITVDTTSSSNLWLH